MNFGNIIDIPLVKAKWPIAVNTSIIDIAILADKAKSYSFFIILSTKSEIVKLNKRTRSGFIFFELLKYKDQKTPK